MMSAQLAINPQARITAKMIREAVYVVSSAETESSSSLTGGGL